MKRHLLYYTTSADENSPEFVVIVRSDARGDLAPVTLDFLIQQATSEDPHRVQWAFEFLNSVAMDDDARETLSDWKIALYDIFVPRYPFSIFDVM